MITIGQALNARHAVILLLLMHAVGLAGLVSPLSPWFLKLTPMNLMFTALVMFLFSVPHRNTIALALLLGTLGYLVEVLGVSTGRVFGVYSYGDVLGLKVAGVPLLIGLNWCVLVFAVGAPLERLRWPIWQKVMAGSAAMVVLDMLIEPVAMHLGFWSWEGDVIPLRNYLAWGAVSAVFFTLFFRLPVRRENPLALWVLAAQLLFFGGLNLLLGLA